jgi:hypothetical protein
MIALRARARAGTLPADVLVPLCGWTPRALFLNLVLNPVASSWEGAVSFFVACVAVSVVVAGLW